MDNLYNFACRTFESILVDSNLNTPKKRNIATKVLLLDFAKKAELLLEDAFKDASLSRPQPTGSVTNPWKEGRLILLPKASNSASSQLARYKPITLLSTLAKVFERCILARLQWLADRHGWLSDNQFGFVHASVVMNSNREFENRAAIIVALRAGRSPKEIVDFLKLPKTTIYRVKKQFDEADSNKEGIATRKKHSRRSDRVRGEEFVKNVKEKIDGNPGKSMRAIAKEKDVGSMTIVRTIHEDLGLKSYALRKGQLLTENMKHNRKGKAAALLNNLKHDSFGMLRFFSDEKNFDVDQKVNPRNDRWICKDPSEIPVVMHTKFPASVMVLGVISSEGDVMPPHFFEKGLRMNADTYINVLETVVKPWMEMVAAGRKYVFQQDSAPAHKVKKTQSWLTLNVPSHWGPDIWPPNSPDCNPLDYYVWGVIARDVNKAPHTTIQSVKKAVHTVMTQMDKVIVAKALIVAVYACGVDVEKGPIRQQLWNAPPCDNVES
ncbi:hypothetical protein LAZ67_4003746 [Cordylochernes scorpioides]|uniref:Transposase n=1 Tax=Cordylochernes scorpioides TaxID=51811 RepID=A0ABY6KE43_9ARAC|nr:hypothetical protein LAZ67_4003746 [Cordylochernes scorpioides]